ncbi:MAG: DPP IV N-terminal domain-containing protein, partial [Allomuricauda sp.]
MGNKFLLCIFTLGFLTFSQAQKKKITLEDIWQGSFRTEYMDALRSMKNGTDYTVLNFNRSPRSSSLDKYNYETSEKVETIVATSGEVPFFSSYTFSKDESKVLLATEIEPIFRHSRLGIYYVYDVGAKSITKISDQKIQEPLLSPDGSAVAYVYNNNIYVFDLAAKSTKQITLDGSKGTIINGVTDWVYEEEFAFVRAFAWNSDGSKIAFLRFDETNVPHFSMDVFGQNLYPFQYEFKYP